MAEVRQRACPVPGPAHTFAGGDIARSPESAERGVSSHSAGSRRYYRARPR